MHTRTSKKTGDIAIIGLACRLPGGASNASKFWDLLSERRSAHSEVPSNRYNVGSFYHPSNDKLNTLSARGGHFIHENVAAFDAPFFNITSQEAKAMDPTARMLLEVTYEALENSGLPIENVAGSDTSCYAACFTRDYHEMLMRDAETAPMYAGTGTGFSLLSNRISWFYDLRGPSLTLDTACSSSLVGLHLARQSIQNKESKVSIISGANLMLSPDLALWLSNLHMLSRSGICKSFSDDASGYGRGEGIATVILKSLSQAIHDGDTIRAIIRGTSVNQDGHTTGITLPNSDAQASLIRTAYFNSGLDPLDTPYFEAHGTGTAVGDPLELGAVASTLCQGREAGNDLYVGSVKSNIGHLEGAAGLAGVIKCVLMLENDVILPNIHFDRPNHQIPFDLWRIKVPTAAVRWPSNSIRRVSVNSFGYGGTNAHAIIDGAPNRQNLYFQPLDRKTMNGLCSSRKQRLFLLSSHDGLSYKRVVQQLKDYLEAMHSKVLFQLDEDNLLNDLAFTLGCRRSSLKWKSHVVASTIQNFVEALSIPAVEPIKPSGKGRIAFVFTGQGAQWARMGSELLEYPIFKESLETADTYLRDALGADWSVVAELERSAQESKIHLAKFSQPPRTIIQVALLDLLRSWNIHPTGVVGHSSGEIAAEYCDGAISREDAWQIAYWRGSLCTDVGVKGAHLKGGMMAAGLSADAAENYISRITQGKLVVACINSSVSVTISGDETGIDELVQLLKQDSVFCRKLNVEYAYHSPHMERFAKDYYENLSEIDPRPPVGVSNVTIVSSALQRVVDFKDLGPEYWVQNMVSPVLFSSAVTTLLQGPAGRQHYLRKGESEFDCILEIGPQAALKGPVRQILEACDIKNVTYKSLLLRGEAATKTVLDAVGALFSHGASPDMSKINSTTRKPKHLWSESRISKIYRFRKHGRHDLFGASAHDFNELEPKWGHFIRPNENPWMRDNVVNGSILYPAAGIIAMALEAANQLADKNLTVKNFRIEDVHIDKAIVVPDDHFGVECILHMRRWWEFALYSCLENQELQENARGNPTEFYSKMATIGLAYGPDFQGLTEIWAGKDHCCCPVEVPNTKDSMPSRVESPHLIHPTTLDIIIHSMFAAFGGGKLDLTNAAVPISFDSIVISASVPSNAGGKLTGFCHTVKDVSNILIGDIFMSDTTWEEPKVQLSGIRCKELPDSVGEGSAAPPVGTILWKPDLELLEDNILSSYLSSTRPNSHLTKSICKYVDLAAHKDPNLSILQIGIGTEGLLSSIFSTLGGNSDETSRYSNYLVADGEKEKIEEAATMTEKWTSNLGFKVLDATQDFHSQGILPASLHLVLATAAFVDIDERSSFLLNAWACLKEGGTLMIVDSSESIQSWKRLITDSHFIEIADPISSFSDCTSMFIARKPQHVQQPIAGPIYILDPPGQGKTAGEISAQLTTSLPNSGVFVKLVTWPPNLNELKGRHLISLLSPTTPFFAGLSSEDFTTLRSVAVLGYFRTLRNENPNLMLQSLHLEDRHPDDRNEKEFAALIAKVAAVESSESEFREIDGQICINRWAADEEITSLMRGASGTMALEKSRAQLKLVHEHLGTQDVPIFTVNKNLPQDLGDCEVEIDVNAIVLNPMRVDKHQQVLDTTAKAYGGIIIRAGLKVSRFQIGNRICSANPGPYRTTIHTHQNLCLRMSELVSDEEAASWPRIYATAYHALINMAKLRPDVQYGVSVLIQNAASAVGQAAVQIGLAYGSEVFATVETEQQHELVKAAAINILTQGRKIDIILRTSGSDRSLGQLWRFTASNGVFIHIAAGEGSDAFGLDTSPFMRGAKFKVLDIDRVVRERLALMTEILCGVSIALRSHHFKPPTPSSIFPASEVSNAFEHLAQVGSAGQVILTFKTNDQLPVSSDAMNQLFLRGNSTYIIVGGLGGLGRSLAILLAENGARHIVTLSRSGATTSAAKELIKRLSAMGATLTAFACDVSDETSLSSVLSQISQNHPPIRGAIQSAAVIRDSIYDTMTHSQWEDSLKPKVQGSWALHKLLLKDMDFFIMLSSISGIFGNRSQANYAAGNTFQDALAEYRFKRGLRTVSVDLGLMTDVGMAAEGVVKVGVKNEEVVEMRESEFWAVMKAAMRGECGGKRVPTQVVCGLPTGGMVKRWGSEEPFYFRDPRFAMLKKSGLDESAETDDKQTKKDTISFQLSKVSSIHEAAEVISVALCHKVAKGLQVSADNIDASKPLHIYGIDSLMAVDIRSWVLMKLKSEISLFDLLSGTSISTLAGNIARTSKLVSEGLDSEC
ncbi:ketoacyl-synt-domain-containing protein [Cadophora sp. DSE1049]|nr:ketoacyl-synt-domain-containing protein [Cadophora sp. DSE1049]